MTLVTLVSLTSALSNLAVLASLVFLVGQLRQNARHQRATMRHGRVQQLQLIYQQAVEGDFVEVLTRGLAGDASLGAADCNRFVWFASAVFNMFENMFDQHREGIADDTTFASARSAMRAQLAMPGMRAAWMAIRSRYEATYAAYVDAMLAATPMDGVADVSETWRGFLRGMQGGTHSLAAG